METYHRKRSKRGAVSNEMIILKREEIPLERQLLIDTGYEVPDEEVELGSVYELFHKNLPPRTPVQLRSTRVVMVSEKTDLNVAIRYPSVLSLRTYFSHGIAEMYPALDEKFVMGSKLARKVLLRQVPSQEFAEKKHLEGFWLVKPNSQVVSQPDLKHEDMGLARELKNNEMVRWGVKRQVMFIGRHKEIGKTQSSSSFVQGGLEEKPKEANDDEDQKEVNNDDEEKEEEMEVKEEADQEANDEEVVEAEEEKEEDGEIKEEAEEDNDEEPEEIKPKPKRKMKCTRNLRKRKMVKPANNQLWQVTKKPMKKCKKLVIRDPTNRWSKERYMAAELSLLEAMKEKKAIIGNPMTRPALRVEARKRIGDTGLLDHLLKHVTDKVAPGGKLRFRRSHNTNGAMEYWLENADLLEIRKEAGVSDPFWTPPPGWKPGDSPIQDPLMAKELNTLKEEMSYMKREFLPKKVFEDEIARLKREIEELSSKNKEDQSKAIVVCDCIDTSPKQVMDICNFLLNSESEVTDDVDTSILSKEKSKQQLMVISDVLKKIETWTQAVEVGKETTKLEATSSKSGTELMSLTVSDTQKHSEKTKPTEDKHKNESAVVGDQKTSDSQQQVPPEGKAAKIERLKSGFRLCRPQGTFLWPNMSSSSQVVPHVEDHHFMVPTPPSVNSSTPPQLPYLPQHHLSLASPVKPVPRALTVTISTMSHPQTSSSSLINLNDIPKNPYNTTAASTRTTNLMSSGVKNDHSWEAYGAIFPSGYKKRKSSSSSASASSSAPSSCLSNTTTPSWLADSGARHKQWF